MNPAAEAKRLERIRRAQVAERREHLEAALAVGFNVDRWLLDRLAQLDVDPCAIRAAGVFGRELMQAHRADAETRRREHAAAMRLRRRGQWPTILRQIKGTNGRAWIVDDGHEHWRRAPQPAKRGNPEQQIRAEVRMLLRAVEPRDLRERLLDILLP